ncbi:hypothetical protein HK103_002505 [Boothiomyces macroporosus]|uniref:CBS domain-containing protein n=1 Tax=Boothiomyces macroporosus TaxID=261099 RepID=A0AAD5UIQ1_9FUNG|nr:hypothetical protein HK103_002505 [Boothiomyces macroporosus]
MKFQLDESTTAQTEFNGPTRHQNDNIYALICKKFGKIATTEVGLVGSSYGQSKVIVTLNNAPNEQIQWLKALGAEIIHTIDSVAEAKKVAKETNSQLIVKPFDFSYYLEIVKSFGNDFEVLIYHVDSEDELLSLKRSLPNKQVIGVMIGDTESKSDLVYVSEKNAFMQARKTIRETQVQIGVQAGAVVYAAKSIVGKKLCVLGDCATSYSKTLLKGACVEDLQLPEATSIFSNSTVKQALDTMSARDFSQLPVTNSKRRIIGLISTEILKTKSADLNDLVSAHMYKFPKTEDYVLVTPYTPLQDLEKLFDKHHALFVTDESAKFPLAVVTKVDVLRFLIKRGY